MHDNIDDYFSEEEQEHIMALGVCYYTDSTMGMCGAFADKKLPMPEIFPDMPLCDKHLVQFAGWTEEDVFLIYLHLLTEIIEELENDDSDGNETIEDQ